MWSDEVRRVAFAPVDEHTLTVRELTRLARQAVSVAFPHEVWVEGEIGSLSRTSRGHVFFDLVEATGDAGPPAATVGVVLFDDVRREVNDVLRATGPVRMTDGVQVRLRGRVELWERSGKVQLRETGIDPAHTLGRRWAPRAAVLARLDADGLVGANGRVPLPALPLHVGLVTSVGSASHADVVHELSGAGLGFRVRVVDVQVQGAAAPAQIAAALVRLERLGVDVALVVRGGGARTDLIAFDDEVVGRAIATASVPVLTGVGHEIDTTVADAVAHRACKTPTACAAELVAHTRRAVDRLDAVTAELGRLAPAGLGRADDRLDAASARLARLGTGHLERARRVLDGRGRRVVGAAGRATTVADRRTQRAASALATSGRHHLRSADRRVADGADALAGRRLDGHAVAVAAADPDRALARGWSITRRADGTLIRRAGDVAEGDVVVTTVADGVVRSTVHGADDAPTPTEEEPRS